MTSTPTRPLDNVVITTKGLQDRNIHILDGTTVENKGKLILRKITFINYLLRKKPGKPLLFIAKLNILIKKSRLVENNGI